MGAAYRYHHRVFLAPPWPEIFAENRDRQHSLESAIAEYERLFEAYTSLGYQIALLPKVSVAERADLVRQVLEV
jgi:predicted ATPase